MRILLQGYDIFRRGNLLARKVVCVIFSIMFPYWEFSIWYLHMSCQICGHVLTFIACSFCGHIKSYMCMFNSASVRNADGQYGRCRSLYRLSWLRQDRCLFIPAFFGLWNVLHIRHLKGFSNSSAISLYSSTNRILPYSCSICRILSFAFVTFAPLGTLVLNEDLWAVWLVFTWFIICLLLYFVLVLSQSRHFHVFVLAMYLTLLFAMNLSFVGSHMCFVSFLFILCFLPQY